MNFIPDMFIEKDNKLHLPVKWEFISFSLLAVGALFLRINNLSADPPIDLALSQGIYTDPGQYISYARNQVLWGSLNPLHDYRLVFFLKSATTLVSYIVFKFFGVGYVEACSVGLIFSFPSLILLYFVIRRIAGNIAALFFFVFIIFDYNQIFYGRLSFLENSMNFSAILSFTILVFARRHYAFVLSGIFLGVTIFFGKIIGLVFLFPFLCYMLWEYFGDFHSGKRKLIFRYFSFALGLIAISIFWYFFSYRPTSVAVEGYVAEQAFNLYGAPDAFKDFSTFVYDYASFGLKSKLFQRMIPAAFLTLGLILLFFYRAGFKESWRNKLYGISPGILFFAALIVAAYGSLMIWNYRPLRYQTMLIYPIYASAGIYASMLIQNVKTGLSRKGNILFLMAFFILILMPIYKLMKPIYIWLEIPFHFVETRTLLLVIAIILTSFVVVFLKYLPDAFKSPPKWFKMAIIILAVLISVVPGAVNYFSWSSAATYTIVNFSEDMDSLLSPEAVVSGPYAALLTQNNKFMNLIHMFGVSEADSILFRRYPITHLLLDKSNKEVAQEHYPEIMKKAVAVIRYDIGGRPVHLYRIAGKTDNIEASGYNLSLYEMAQYYYMNDNIAAGHELMKRNLIKNPNSYSSVFTSARIANDNEYYDEAEYYYKKAFELCPTDFYLRFKAGEFYIGLYENTGDIKYKSEAIKQFDLALKYNNISRKLVRDINKLLQENSSTG